jgi:hypothetical protein
MTMRVLSIIALGFFAAALIVLFFVKIPAENQTLINTVLVGLIAVVMTIKDYYFGGSNSAAVAHRAINSMNQPPSPPQDEAREGGR